VVETQLQVKGVKRKWFLPLVLVLSLWGVTHGLAAESAAPETDSFENAAPASPKPAETSTIPQPATPPVTPATPPSDTSVPQATASTCPPAVMANSPAPGTPEARLRTFRIVGNKTVSTKEIKKELSEKLPSFWPPWGKPPFFRPQDLEYDVQRFKTFYRSQGFYHTEIKPEVSCGPKGDVIVTLVIHEGPPVIVTDINVEIAGKVDLSDLRKKWPINPGDRFTEKDYDALKNLYLNYLPNHGYPRVKVRGRVFLDEEKNTAKIHLTVNPGPLSYFGEVKIKNPEKLETPPEAILEKLTFKPGEVFNLGELFNTQRKLYTTDLFRGVVLTPEKVPPQESSIPIDIEIDEKKQRSLKLGLGYGDEEKVRARLGLRYRNLGGGGRLLDLDARYSALGYLFSELFTNPAVNGTHLDFINQSGARRRDLPGFTDQAYYTQSRLERDIPYNFRFYFGHGLEFARPFDIPLSTLVLLEGTQPEKVYRASYGLLGLRQDTVDNPANPHHGGYIDWANQISPTFFGSNLQFAQTVLEIRRYHGIADSNFVVAGRTRVGLIQPMQQTQQIPISRLFFAGGANSVRGYGLDLLGPRNAQNNPIGGEAVVELSLEGRFPIPIYKNIGGVVFMDAGNVYRRIHNFDLGQLKYSPGFGLRYLSPVGAIGLDFAFPTNRINYVTDKWYQIHFSVGYGF
jgi:outer membrane protein assembly complex protein YaeT